MLANYLNAEHCLDSIVEMFLSLLWRFERVSSKQNVTIPLDDCERPFK